MAGIPSKYAHKMYNFQKPNRWSTGIGLELPEAYKKFWKEWKLTTPTPVHYIPKEGKYEMLNGQIQPVQNVPLPLKYPKEIDTGIWGGEAVLMGFVKKTKYKRRFRRYWVPELKKSVVHSEILDKYMRTVVTERTLELIHSHHGFDHYILKTQACDLRSLLALKLKREMLLSLYDKTLYPNDEAKKNEVYEKYKNYLEGYTKEDIEWYGLTYPEATQKWIKMKTDAYNPIPLKNIYRKEFIKKLEEEKLGLGEGEPTEKSWISKLNPFSGSKSSTAA